MKNLKEKNIQTEEASHLPTLTPAVGVIENYKELILLAAFPGVSQKNLIVRLDSDIPTIEGMVADYT